MSNKNISLDIKHVHHKAFISDQIELLETGCLWFPLDGYSIFSIKGSDKRTWLQGQITNNILGVDHQHKVDYCMCKSTGQIEAVGSLLLGENEDILIIPSSCEEYLHHTFNERVIMEDVTMHSTPYSVVSIIGQAANACIEHALNISIKNQGSFSNISKSFCVPNNKTGYPEYDLIIHEEDMMLFEPLLKTLPKGEIGTYYLTQVENHQPNFGIDIDHKTLPQELGKNFIDQHVSYQKGCYVGQEVIMRIHTRGHTNKTWVTITTGSQVKDESDILNTKGEKIGKINKSFYSPKFDYISSAMLKNDYAWEDTIVNCLSADTDEYIIGTVHIHPLKRGSVL